MNPQEVQDFKERIEKETIDNIIKSIEVNDSFFYAKMVVMRESMANDPFGHKIKAIIRINLYNSEEFERPNITNNNRKLLKGKEIRTEVTLDVNELDSKAEAMRLIYKTVASEITENLFMRNAENIEMAVNNMQRKYI